MIWNVIMTVVLLISFVMIPFNIGLKEPEPHDKKELTREIIIDVIMLLDIFFSFITDQYSEPGAPVTNQIIAQSYLVGFFFPDFLSCVPSLVRSIIYKKIDNGAEIFYLLKLLRFGHLPRIKIYTELILDFLIDAGPKHILRNFKYIIKLFGNFILTIHCAACGWLWVGDFSDEWATGWVISERQTFEPNTSKTYQIWSIYCSAFYFILTTATTVGYGDYTGATSWERLYLCLIEFIGICSYSMIYNGVTNQLIFIPTIN